MDYQAYLRSPIWQAKRELILDFYGNKCAVCNSTDGVDVHHRTYERIGHERWSDLVALCRYCHSLHHDKLQPMQVFNRIEEMLKGVPR